MNQFRKAGVPVGLGVDGSASNDSAHMLGEVRQAMLVSRLRDGLSGTDDSLMTARDALEMATLGGARVLGRDDIGSLELGRCADWIAIRADRLEFAGAWRDPVAALVFCQPVNVDFSMVGGRWIVRDGRLVTIDVESTRQQHFLCSRRLADNIQ